MEANFQFYNLRYSSDCKIVWVFFLPTPTSPTQVFFGGNGDGPEVCDYKHKLGQVLHFLPTQNNSENASKPCSGALCRDTSTALLLETWDEVSSSFSSAVLSWEFWDIISSP